MLKVNFENQEIPERKIVRVGNRTFDQGDFYHFLITISWSLFFLLTGLAYLLINIIFACAYLLDNNGIENAQPGSFRDAFFFSVQTMATIGYGAMYPRTAYSHLLVTVEVFVGLLAVAMATGLMFARFSRPTARVMFSKVAVVCPYEGVPTLMFRTANQRWNSIVEAQVRVTLVRNEISPEGLRLRRLHDLKLIRSETPAFSLTWTIMHPIDETSPLYRRGKEASNNLFFQPEDRIIVMLTGLDDTVAQTIHSRHDYWLKNILLNATFVDILSREENNYTYINYGDFHKIIPIDSNFSSGEVQQLLIVENGGETP